MLSSENIADLSAALVKASTAFQPFHKDSKANIPTKSGGSFSYQYASLEHIMDSVRPGLAANGLAIMHDAGQYLETGKLIVTTRLIHQSGQWIENNVIMRVTNDDPQGAGSAITYGRRYGVCALLGLVADEDDDGQAASQRDAPKGQPQRQGTPRGLAATAEALGATPVKPKDATFDAVDVITDWLKEHHLAWNSEAVTAILGAKPRDKQTVAEIMETWLSAPRNTIESFKASVAAMQQELSEHDNQPGELER